MKIVIIRHGEAVDAAMVGGDAERYLSARGRATSRDVARALVQHGFTPTHIYTSPLVRAVQTAEVLAQVVGHEGEVVSHPSLTPDGARGHALSMLDMHGADEVIALVSHEPTVRVLAGHLVGAPFPAFRTSGAAILEGDGSGAVLVGRLDPTTLTLTR